MADVQEVDTFREENNMNKDQKRKEIPSMNNKRMLAFEYTRDAKKPYKTPALVKLGDVAKLTNVSVIV